MKRIKSIMAAGLITLSAPAFAQFTNDGSTNTGPSSTNTSYNRIEVSYNPVSLSSDYDGVDDEDLTGISAAYIRGISLSKTIPLYIETGLRLTYAWYSEDESDSGTGYEYVDGYGLVGYNYTANVEEKFTYLGIIVPINLAYRFAIPDSKVTITPYAGITLRGNIIAKDKLDASVTVSVPGYGSETVSEEESYNMFDKDDVGKDLQFNRIQLGWDIGMNVAFNKFNVGLSYGSDFTNLCKKTKTNNWSVSVGCNF
ncbi:MAG: outer membrane beta-barrel protein [Muribaculaceae bacterium]|nr:outer membrane beta-barrel protein [Muribaculaceae bacterium]